MGKWKEIGRLLISLIRQAVAFPPLLASYINIKQNKCRTRAVV